MIKSRIIVAFAAAILAGKAASQPVARGHHWLFYDDARQRVLLAGGTSVTGRNYTLLNDLWSFDGATWTALRSSGPGISGFRVAIDAANRVYSFGGYNGESIGDVRVLEGEQWRVLGQHPSVVVAEGGFVYDEARKRFVAFGGGMAQGQMLADTWEFDGGTWTKSAVASPPARGSHVMVYDSRRHRIVVFGGMGVAPAGQRPPILGDTWEFDGTKWTQLRVSGPAPRMASGATYDTKRGLVIVFGGSDHDGVKNDLWSWDGTSWKKLAENGPEPRVMGLIAYDRKRDRVVMFGGRRGVPDNSDLGDTWEWDGASWRRVPLR